MSQNIYERGVDDAGFGRIRSKGDSAWFGGYTTQEMTIYNVEEKDLQGEIAITSEHIQNNSSVRDMLGERGIKPEELPPSEDIKELERRVKTQEKKIAEQSGRFSVASDNEEE